MKRNTLLWIAATLLLVTLSTATISCKGQREDLKPTHKITIAYPLSMYSVLYQIALEKGYFQAEGLEIMPQPHEFGRVAVRSMLEGKADLAISGDTVLMFAIANGNKIGIIAENLTSKRNEAIVARKDRGITTPIRLEGRSIGVALGTTGHFFLDSFMTVNGINKNKVKLVSLTPGQMISALENGAVDAVSVWQPHIKQIELAMGGRGVVFYDERVYSDIVCFSASQEFIKRNPEVIKKILKALIRAEVFVSEHVEESKYIVAKDLKIDKTILDGIWENLFFRITLQQALLVSLEDQFSWAKENRLLKNKTSPFFLDFIYMEPLQSLKPSAVRIIR